MLITTKAGNERDIDPTAITIITGPAPGDQPPCSCIFGVAPKFLKITQDAPAFIATLPNSANFARLRFAKGANFWVNALQVASIRAASPSDAVRLPLCEAVISFQQSERYIQEEVIIATASINAAGGNL